MKTTRGTASVIVDSREPAVIQSAVLAALKGTPASTLITALETADFVIRDGCPAPCLAAIERKKVSDLLESFRSGRLDKQLTRLRTQYTYPILLVEGGLRMNEDGKLICGRNRLTNWSHASIQMFLWSLQRREGVAVLFTHDIAGTADLVRILARRAAEGCVAHLDLGTAASG